VPFVFTVTNPGRVSVTLHLLGRTPTADFRVSDARGRIIWTRLHARTLLGPLRLSSLGAGKSLSFRHVWDQRGDTGDPVPPGEYLIRGVLLTDEAEGLASPSARLRIER
jgi:hypothetical protein